MMVRQTIWTAVDRPIRAGARYEYVMMTTYGGAR
jgi:hypothetical protein